MAKIPLRAYVKEIENLIERGEIEQAIAHARNVLKSYPKHIETYRLLGKAYLESQRYAEAADILQRVLSVFPDDFISQIGMSIIREDENNLDAAIWHMERAYEVQPFNPAVQDELRRLYGRRDGVEPPKIRLTRGALVRMYTRGELYPQAIAETRAALAEDPQRLDLQVLLARLYFLSNQKVEAAEVCSSLLSKLPYCYDANHILAEVLPGTNRADDARKFQQRIFAMEPYAAFISPTAPSVDQVPDQSVMVERFIWDPAAAGAQSPSPDWARTAGVQWEEEESQPAEDLPDWLGMLKPEEPARPAPGFESQAEESAISSDDLSSLFAADATEQAAQSNADAGIAAQPTAADDLVPDWMKEAGWAKTDRSADEIAKEQLQRDAEMGLAGDAEAAEAEQGDIPDWLKSMAPPQTQDTGEEQQRDEWLSSLLDEQTGTPAAEQQPPAASMGEQLGETEQPSDVPDWLAGLDEAGAAAGAAAAASALPDWLSGGEEPKPAENKPVDDLEWEQATSAYAADRSGTDETPDWLRDLDSDSSQPATAMGSEGGEAPSSEDNWLQSFQQGQPDTAAAPSPEDDTPEWLRSFSEENQAETKPAAEEPWMQSLSGESDAVSGEAPSDLPEWLLSDEPQASGMTPPAAAAEPGTADEETESPTGSTPEWLQSIEANEAIRSDETGPTRVSTDWLKSFESDSEPPAEAPSVTESSAEAPSVTESSAEVDWMSSIEGAPGSSEGGSGAVTEEAEIPDWLQSLESDQEPAASTSAGIAAEPSGAESVTEDAEIPDWLQSLESDQQAAAPASAGITAEPSGAESVTEEAEIPDWLQSLESDQEPAAPASAGITAEPSGVESTGVVKPADEQESVMPDFADMDSAMAWLESLAAKQGADEQTLVTPPEQRTETPPDWVQKAAEETGAGQPEAIQPLADAQPAEEPAQQEPVTPPQEVTPAFDAQQPQAPEAPQAEQAVPDFAGMDEAMAWLESLAAKQGADEQTLVTPPEQRTETPPDWVQKAAEEGASESGASASDALESGALESGTPEIGAPESAVESEPAFNTFAELPQGEAGETAGTEPADLPDWLKDYQEEQALPSTTPEPAASTGVELPDWLAGMADESEPATSQPEPPAAEEREAAEAVSDLTGQPLPPAEPSTPELSDMDAAMAWLESLAAKHGADEQTLVTPPEQRLETPPDWVTKEATEETASPAEEQPAPTFDTQRAPDFPDWLDQAGQQEAEAQAGAPELQEPELPSADFGAVEKATGIPQAVEEFSWEEQIAAESPAPEAQPAPEQPSAEAPVSESTGAGDLPDFDNMDADAAMAWLESLAAKHGADEQTLVTPPEQRTETPPEWVQKAAEEGEQAASMAAAPETAQPVADQPAAELAEEETPAQPPAAPEVVESPAVAELRQEEENLPDWLKDMVEIETPQAGEGATPETTGAETASAEAASQAEEPEAGMPTQPAAGWTSDEPSAVETHKPDLAWLVEETTSNLTAEQAGQATEEAPGAEEDMDEAFAWLESLAAKQGAQDGTLLTTPEDRVETPPDWVFESADSEITGPAVQAEEPPAEPQWESLQRPHAETMFDAETPEDVEEPAAPPPVPASSMWQFEEQPQPEQEDLPDWLRQPEAGQAQPAADQQEAVPDWLKNIEDEAEADPFTGSVFPGETIEAAAATEYPTSWAAEEAVPPLMDEPQPQQPAYPGGVPTTLEAAQSALLHGQVENALEYYNNAIANGEQLEETIHDLRDALYRYPVDITIWQALGDAYARNNQLQEALDAYTKAEELLR